MHRPRSLSAGRPVPAFLFALIVGVSTLAGSTTRAAITDASGRVESSVEQTSGSTGQIIDQAFEETPGTTTILPATANADLDITTPTAVQGYLSSVAAVNVPGTNSPADVNDFSMEASGLSLLADRGFGCSAKATQHREITLSATELNLDSGTQVQVRSDFVIASGVLMMTFTDGPSDAVGRVDFTIQQEDAEGSRQVLSGSLDVSLDENGMLQIVATGGLDGVLPITVDMTGESSDIASAQMVLLPAVTIPYEYLAVVDRPFTLTAQVDVSATAASGDQGVSAFVGRLPHFFADQAVDLLGVDYGSDLDMLGASSQARAAGIRVTDQITPVRSGLESGCGSFGLEALLGGLLLSAAFVSRRLT